MLENEKKQILNRLQEMEELDMVDETQLEEGPLDWLQKMANALTKGFKLDGQYLPKSPNKNNVTKYGTAIGKLKQLVPELSDVQAQEAVAILLDSKKMPTFIAGSIFPSFDPATGIIKFASKAGGSNPNPGGPGE